MQGGAEKDGFRYKILAGIIRQLFEAAESPRFSLTLLSAFGGALELSISESMSPSLASPGCKIDRLYFTTIAF